MREEHFCVDEHGCAVHDYGYTDRVCSCREYWSHPAMTGKAWGLDHNVFRCHRAGGACSKEDVAFQKDVWDRMGRYFKAVKEGRLPI